MVKIPHWPIAQKTKFPRDLQKVYEALEILDNPHLKLPKPIHITGTNGKGSVVAYLAAIFSSAGYTSHRYISPHLVEYNERITIADQRISDSLLQLYLEECRIKCGAMNLSFFEGTTVAGFLAFSRNYADVAIIEVGMGGRLDATNVINPVMTIITPISYDHTEYLGNSLSEIAKEKSGIIKKGIPCVISWQESEAMDVLLEKCKQEEAPTLVYGQHWTLRRKEDDGIEINITCPLALLCSVNLGISEVTQIIKNEAKYINNKPYYIVNYRIELECIIAKLELPPPGLKGVHQYINASTAAVAAWFLKFLYYPKINIVDIAKGLTNVIWPARLQKIENGVLATFLYRGAELWLDGAHNNAGAAMLAASMHDMKPSKMLYLINGRTKDRDIAGFLENFKEITAMVCAVKVKSEPLAEESIKIKEVAQNIGFRAIEATSVLEAVKLCIQDAATRECRILICGSLYLAGDVLLANHELQ